MPYLDNAATTAVEPRVLEAMMPHFREAYGNASSIHGYGRQARKAVEAARRHVAALVGAEPREVIFTSGGTEADNTALLGLMRANAQPGGHLIVSRVEHHAVLHAADVLEAMGYAVTRVPVDGDGRVDVEAVRAAVRPDTALISVMWVNNETGVIQPVAELAALARESGTLFHTDAVQAAGHLPIDMGEAGVHALSLSSHKLSGPKGVGALVVRTGVEIAPLAVGGAQERGRRAGTENVPGIVGFGEAARQWLEEGGERQRRLEVLGSALREGLVAIPGAHVTGPRTGVLGHIVNVRFDGVDGEALLLNLDLGGIAASSGSACTSGSLDPSHVLLAMGLSRQEAGGAVRFSLGIVNTEDDVRAAVGVTAEAVGRVRRVASSIGEEIGG